ncbi:MAG: FAD:protein FMN transferase [Paracoccaceae bacterium]|nr:FAD:protein FMN transferase [Paracoccaceae bacterium]
MTQHGLSRRRVLQIAAALPVVGLSTRAKASAPAAYWRGVALGASSQIVLAGLTQGEAAPVFAQVRDEVSRLEGIFSLFQRRSALSLLNQTGHLDAPAPELLEVLSLSQSVWNASCGAFDPTIQPTWQARSRGANPAPHRSFSDLRFNATKVTLALGMALTFNGIAQGYITDRITALLSRAGLVDAVVDAGEQRATGQRPDGGPWRVGIANPAGVLLKQVSLRDRSLATSSSYGTRLAGGAGHIIDARDGLPATRWSTVSVMHDSAALADALSTAACCLSVGETDAMLTHFRDARLILRT